MRHRRVIFAHNRTMTSLASSAFVKPIGFIYSLRSFSTCSLASANAARAASPVDTNIEQFCSSLQFTSSARCLFAELCNISVVFGEWVDAPQETKEQKCVKEESDRPGHSVTNGEVISQPASAQSRSTSSGTSQVSPAYPGPLGSDVLMLSALERRR